MSIVTRKRLDIKRDLELAAQGIISAAHSIAHTEIIRRGRICEQDVIYRAMEVDPDLFQKIYIDVLSKRKNRRVLSAALDAIDGYLEEHYQAHLKPLLGFSRNTTESCRCRRSATTSLFLRCTRGIWQLPANGSNGKDCCKRFPRRSN